LKLEPADFPPEILDAIANRIAEKLRAVLAPPPAVVDFITRREAVLLGIELKALMAAERAGTLPAFKPGRAVVYRRGDVITLIESSRVVVSEEPANVVDLPIDPFERAVARAQRRKRGA
jgi:hypothetical protein